MDLNAVISCLKEQNFLDDRELMAYAQNYSVSNGMVAVMSETLLVTICQNMIYVFHTDTDCTYFDNSIAIPLEDIKDIKIKTNLLGLQKNISFKYADGEYNFLFPKKGDNLIKFFTELNQKDMQ